MGSESSAPRSRRALLAAAAGAAGALAANAVLPLSAAAAATNLQTEIDNPTVATTSVTQATDLLVAFKAKTVLTGAAGLVGSTGDESGIATDTSFTGVYGWSPTGGTTISGTGVWGDSTDLGVFGSGAVGVLGDGATGVVGFGTEGVYGYGTIGVTGESDSATSPGVKALGLTASAPALEVVGKVKFNRSGRKSMSSGKSSVVVSLAGVSTSSKVFAVLATSESGRWVRAVVPAAGKFTVYLNTRLSSSAVVAWFVLD